MPAHRDTLGYPPRKHPQRSRSPAYGASIEAQAPWTHRPRASSRVPAQRGLRHYSPVTSAKAGRIHGLRNASRFSTGTGALGRRGWPSRSRAIAHRFVGCLASKGFGPPYRPDWRAKLKINRLVESRRRRSGDLAIDAGIIVESAGRCWHARQRCCEDGCESSGEDRPAL